MVCVKGYFWKEWRNPNSRHHAPSFSPTPSPRLSLDPTERPLVKTTIAKMDRKSPRGCVVAGAYRPGGWGVGCRDLAVAMASLERSLRADVAAACAATCGCDPASALRSQSWRHQAGSPA